MAKHGTKCPDHLEIGPVLLSASTNISLERAPRAWLLIDGSDQIGGFGCKMEGGPLSSKALGCGAWEFRPVVPAHVAT